MTWDETGKGVIKAEDIMQPLTALGLSEAGETQEHIQKFLKTLVCAILNKNEENNHIEDLWIDLLTFLKMFKTDSVSKTIAEIVKKEAWEKDLW